MEGKKAEFVIGLSVLQPSIRAWNGQAWCFVKRECAPSDGSDLYWQGRFLNGIKRGLITPCDEGIPRGGYKEIYCGEIDPWANGFLVSPEKTAVTGSHSATIWVGEERIRVTGLEYSNPDSQEMVQVDESQQGPLMLCNVRPEKVDDSLDVWIQLDRRSAQHNLSKIVAQVA